jgi:beta-lactamase superfamily II metal-dependent hydrolase
MAFEIEFFPVGDASKAGDAISIRYTENGQYRIMIIDGGTDDAGEALVQHVRQVYGAGAVISDVISTHPDADHACGLRAVLHDLPVERLWIHGLWHHAEAIVQLFENNWTAQGLAAAIKREYPVVAELIDLAVQKQIPVFEPFAGEKIGPFTVLSPNRPTYQHLIPQFRRTPEPKKDLLEQREIWLGASKDGVLSKLFTGLIEAAANWIPESWDVELLREGGITAAENESSTVLYGDFAECKALLTADAGVNALRWASAHAAAVGINLSALTFFQVPHHGSRRNVSPSILNLVVGPRLPANSPATRLGVVSAPKDDASHPRKMVLNAFRRRGVGISTTQNGHYRRYVGMPPRQDETPARYFDFFSQVEAYDQ